MNEKFLRLLSSIDLTKNQIKIYQATMKLGMPTVFELGEYLKINRPAIYKDTGVLLERGILELGANKPRKFLAVNPKRIKSLIEEKRDKLLALENTLDEVEDFYQSRERKSENDISLKIFENNNIKKAYLFEAADAKDSEILIISGPSEHMNKYFDDSFFDTFVSKCRKNNVRLRVIASQSDKRSVRYYSTSNYKNSQVKTLSNLGMKVSIDVWNDNVIVSTFEKAEARAVLHTNKVMAEGYKNLFENFWKIASF